MRFILIILLLTATVGCSPDEHPITKRDVLEALESKGYQVIPTDKMPHTFNGVTSNAYDFVEEWIYIFVYKNTEERNKGMMAYNQFREENPSWMPGKTYTLENVFILHLKLKNEIDEEMNTVLESLNQR